MKEPTELTARLAARREACGLSHDELATHLGVSKPCVYDLESHEEELFLVYCAADLKKYARALKTTPRELLGIETGSQPIDFATLAQLIKSHCEARSLSITSFEDLVGWRLEKIVATPDLFLDEISLDGLRDVCGGLEVDWRRVILSL